VEKRTNEDSETREEGMKIDAEAADGAPERDRKNGKIWF